MLYRRQELPVYDEIRIVNASKKIASHTGITEVVLPSIQGLDMVLPSLAFLSQTSDNENNNTRWLTWFPPVGVTKSLLLSYGFDLSRVRFIYPKNSEDCFWLFWEALAEGNSHTVVASPGILTEQQVSRLEHASVVGNCSGLLLRTRIH